MIGIDAYDLQARHAPVMFAVSPAILVAIVLIPGLGNDKFAVGTIAFMLLAALSFMATRFARSAGRSRQDALFATWDGMPTTAMLRYRDPRLEREIKRAYRERLKRLGSKFPIPNEQDEERDPTQADAQIAAAMNEVRIKAKAKGVKTVHRENINYGAARNAYGLKPFGLGAVALALATLGAAVAIRGETVPNSVELVGTMAILLIGGVWVFGSTPEKVRQHAEAYALALFEAIDQVLVRRAA